jgi:AcrR family transcriptional regulator
MGRRSDHSREEIRQMALQAAESIVTQGGYKALSARKVASEIGYTVGTLYLVFENLDELVLHVNGRTLDLMNTWLEQRVDVDRKSSETLCQLASSYIEFAEQNLSRWNMLFEYITEKGNQLPAWYEEKIGRVFSLIEKALPVINNPIDQASDEQIARVLWASVHGICTLRIRQRLDLAGGQSTEAMTHLLIKNFIRGRQGKAST